ncbi:MAG: hypothetical protein HC854_10480, partial [Flavobacterium sp.]|nr:hypothetical protein [Flavobacterium sp.]
MKTIQIVPTIHNKKDATQYSISKSDIDLNILLQLPADKPIEINEGFIIIQNDIIWNSETGKIDNVVIESPRMSLELLFAGAELFSGKQEIDFSFWEHSGAHLSRKSENKVTLVDNTCDKKSLLKPYF